MYYNRYRFQWKSGLCSKHISPGSQEMQQFITLAFCPLNPFEKALAL